MRTATLIVLGLLLAQASAADADRRRQDKNSARVRLPHPGRMLKAIQLEPEQCRKLADLARSASELFDRHEAAQARQLPAFHEALLGLRAEVSIDHPPTPETIKRVNAVNRTLKTARRGLMDQVAEIEAQAMRVLTPMQRERASLTRGQPGTEAARLHRQIAEIHAHRYGSLGRLGRWLLTPGLDGLLVAHAEGREPPRLRAPKPAPLAAQIGRLREEINLWNLINGMHFTCDQLERIADAACLPRGERAQAVAAAGGLLSAEQKEVLVDYKPCLVPPKNLRDPVRVGQAQDTTGGVRMLKGLRTIPDRRFYADHDGILMGLLARIEEHEGAYGDGEKLGCYLILADAVQRARAMDDVQFQVHAEELAAGLQPLFRLKNLEKKLHDTLGKQRIVETKVQRFLLDPMIPALCRQRQRLVQSGIKIRPDGPVAKAEHCESCGSP